MKKSRTDNGIDYWDSLADGMLALFLCVLLIVLLFTLFFVQIPPYKEEVDDEEGDNVAAALGSVIYPEEHREDYKYDNPHPGEDEEEEDNQTIVVSGGGGDHGGERGREPREEQDQYYWGYGEEGEKSAVLVEVVDGETMLPLVREGIMFELYDDSERLQTLIDYYPEPVEHTRFETTKRGYFYLPEKIHEGKYYLRELTEVEGYGPAENTTFLLDDYYDWDKPFHVYVRLYSLRSAVRIRMVDRETAEGIPGAVFRVYAAEDVVTLDGTVRYHAGDEVDSITTGAGGYAETKELYFGRYLIRQEQVPEFYGMVSEDIETELREKTARGEAAAVTIQAEKTAMLVRVCDALYDSTPIVGAAFFVTDGNQSMSYVSNAAGEIFLTDLRKNTTYRIRQTEAPSDYRRDTAEHSFTVDAKGRINGMVRGEISVENRMIRTSFQVTGTLLTAQMSDIRMVLMDQQGRIIRQWTTSGQAEQITGLEPGTYQLIIGSDVENPIDIFVDDEASLQEFRFTRWTRTDTSIVAFALMLLVITLLIVVSIARRRRRRSQRGTSKT